MEGDKSTIIRIIKRDPFIEYDVIREQSGTTACDLTILPMLKESNYDYWTDQERPFLNTKLAVKRLQYASKYLNTTSDDWQKIL